MSSAHDNQQQQQQPETNTGSGSLHPVFTDPNSTPRSGEPPTIVSTKPTPTYNEPLRDEGYFALNPTHSHTSAATSSIQASPSSSIASSSSSSLQLKDAILDATRRLSAHIDAHGRPRVVTTDSTATITASSAGLRQQGPQYPNQAFSALHQQHYPAPHIPPVRSRSYYPQQPVTLHTRQQSLHQSGTRTTANSPGAVPGLFNPNPTSIDSEPLETPSSDGAYPSPYLHYLHAQIPKETHVADIDVDPISGRKIINDYEIIDELGRGTHGKVKLARSLITGQHVAIKIVERYPKKRRLGKMGNAEDKVKREVAILKKARHPNIVALLEVIDDPARRKVYIVLERVDLGEIPWRVEGTKDIALVEYRRYERESHGIFDDHRALEEDQDIYDLARVRRQKAVKTKRRRARKAGQRGVNVWSMELAGDSGDESDADASSRMSGSTNDRGSADALAEIERIMSREPEYIPPFEHPELATPETPTGIEAHSPDLVDMPGGEHRDRLEGTMYGSYDSDHSPFEDKSENMHPHEIPHADVSALTISLSHGNRLQRATDLLEDPMHPDLRYVPTMTFGNARNTFRDTVLGLQYLHYQGIIHRDIKPPNLLQTRDRRTKISDFGVSYLGRPMDEGHADSLSESDAQDLDEAKELAKTVGTAAFYAPELCYTDMESDHPPVGKAIDVWALGITLFSMIFARVPFADSEFVVMRRIAEEEIYIPRKRLRPVARHVKSRPSSNARESVFEYRLRSPFVLEYEELDDNLIDLLHRLLTKDPRERITLDEVRYHPWVVEDLYDQARWFAESDPYGEMKGKKIEVTKEDLEHSLVPINLVDRIRSGFKKAVGSLGLGRSSSTRRREAREASSGAGTPSASSSSGNVTIEGRRSSLRGDESILSALKASRDGDHPLTQSVAASPEEAPRQALYANTTSLASPVSGADPFTPSTQTLRPSLPDRSASALSTTASVRTVRPSDHGLEALREQPVANSPTLDSTEGPNADRSAGLLLGANRLLKSVRDRSAASRSSEQRERSSSRASSEAGDTHADASIAVSTASAAGTLDPPQALKEMTPASSSAASKTTSPTSTRQGSAVVSPSHLTQPLFQNFSLGAPLGSMGVQKPPTPYSRPPSRLPNESADVDFEKAEQELLRRHIAESRQRVVQDSRTSRLPPGHAQDPCPPSPDDETDQPRRARFSTRSSAAASMAPSLETSPASPNSSLLPLMTPTSSDDRFAPGLSAPQPYTLAVPIPSSGPSGACDTDYGLEEENRADTATAGKSVGAAGQSVRQTLADEEEDHGYQPDRALESDEDDYEDSSDDDGGLQMVRRKSIAQSGGRSVSISNAQLARYRERRGTGGSAFSKKSSRSGSSNTMKKVRSHQDSEPEDSRGRTLSPP